MQFFNFGNGPTYHYFAWLQKNKEDTAGLIRKAFDQVEKDDWFKMGECPSVVARDRLADLLEELFDLQIAEVFTEYVSFYDGPGIGDVDDSAESLALPLFMEAARSISFTIVAHALLIDAGKWNPDPIEDKFPLPGADCPDAEARQ
jgi:hypothetical protein